MYVTTLQSLSFVVLAPGKLKSIQWPRTFPIYRSQTSIWRKNILKKCQCIEERWTHSQFTALKSFNVEEAVRTSGVYEIQNGNQVVYIGGNPYFSNIRDCLNAHFSGNDGLTIGAWLSGPGKKEWQNITVRWMTCSNPHEVAFYLLEEYRGRNGYLPIYNNPPATPSVPQSQLYSDSDSDD
ncbi:hypothetical protein QZH41_019418 [Actinostola sp. cb2023]|nr:hypothetical protein QZH41_019418 [Actinostola sp. cb2023]